VSLIFGAGLDARDGGARGPSWAAGAAVVAGEKKKRTMRELKNLARLRVIIALCGFI